MGKKQAYIPTNPENRPKNIKAAVFDTSFKFLIGIKIAKRNKDKGIIAQPISPQKNAYRQFLKVIGL